MEKKEQKNGLICPMCGGMLIMANEVSLLYEGDEEAISSNYTCNRCGRLYQITDPEKDAREGQYREYWNK